MTGTTFAGPTVAGETDLDRRSARWRRHPVDVAGQLFLVVFALVLWATSIRSVDLDALTDLGLAPILPGRTLVAIGLLCAAFAWELYRQPVRSPLLAVHVVALIVVLYGTTAMIEPVPGYRVVWRHAGVIDTILRTEAVDPRVDAYFNWPGFFVLAAFVTEVTGLDALAIGSWAPVFFNLLYLGPLLLVVGHATRDARLAWLAVLIYYLSNWVGQDYLSPQALMYFVYLVVLALILRWFPSYRNPGSPGQRAALMMTLITLFAIVVPSHQLTPFALIASVGALVLFRRCQARGLPILFAVLTFTWLVYMTGAYQAGHLEQLLSEVGRLATLAWANVGERIQGSPEHVLVVRLRLVATAGLWLLAGAGWWRRWRRGQREPDYALLAVAPFTLLALQSYGGEMLLRVFFLSLPFMAFLAASALLPERLPKPTARRAVAIFVFSLLLVGLFLFTRFGNERTEYFTEAEVVAVEHLYRIAPPGSLLLAANENLPWKSQAYDQHRYTTFQRLSEQNEDQSKTLSTLVFDNVEHYQESGAFVVFTQSQEAYDEAFRTAPGHDLHAVEAALRASRQFWLVYANEDARIYRQKEHEWPRV